MAESTGTSFESALPVGEPELPSDATQAQTAEAVVEVPLPPPGKTVRIPVAAGQAVRFAFELGSAESVQQDGDLVLEVDGGTVVLEGFEAAILGEIPVEITNADGTVINMADFLVALGISPEAMTEPAAGATGTLSGTPANEGAGFAPGQAPTILASLSARGPVDPTALGYDVPERTPSLLEFDEEIDGAGGELGSSVTTDVDGGEGGYGYDDPNAITGEFSGGFEDWTPNQHVGDYSSSPMKLDVALVASDNEEIVSVTIVGVPGGVVIFAPGQIVVGDGSNSVTIPAADLNAVYVLPPADADGDIPLDLQAEIVDPDSGLTSTVEGSVTAVVDAAADRPQDVQADAPTEVGIGTAVSFEIQAQFGDWTDGSEDHFLLIEMPAGWSDPSGAYETESFAPGNSWGIPEGSYICVPATVDPATGVGTATVVLQAPTSLPAESGSETFHFGVVGKAVDAAGDGELTDANNASYTPIGESTQLPEIPVTVTKPQLSIDDVTVDEDAGTATFTVTLHGATGVAVVLGYGTTDGSAADGAGESGAGIPDYTTAGGNLVFPASDDPTQTLTVTVPITDDQVFENPESFLVDLLGVDPTIVDVAGSDLQGVGTIIDNDPVPAISISDGQPVPQAEPDAAGDTPTKISFTVTLSNPSSETVTVAYQTVGGTALEGIDFENESGLLTFAPGETTKTIEIEVSGDDIDELLEQFTVELSSPANASIADGEGVGQIADTDPTPVLTIDDASATEGEGLVFALSLSNPSSGDIVLDLATGNPGTATGGIDYETVTFEYFDGANWVAAGGPNGTQVTIGAGQTSLQVRVDSLEDAIHELNETFTLKATKAAGSADVVTGDKGTGTILDDDPQPTISISDGQPVPQAEPDASGDAPTTISFTVTLSNPSSQAVTVAYQTLGGTALDGLDFEGQSGLITFAPGETSKTIAIDVYGDDIDELLEQFTVELSSPTNATILDGQGTGQIADTDAMPVLTIGNASASEGEGLVFTLSLSNPSAGDIVLDLAAGTPGSATPGVDHETTTFEYFDGTAWVAAGGPDGTLVTIPAGQTALQVRVASTEDSLDELDETFTLSAGAAAGSAAVVTDDTGTGTILDDDAQPTLAIDDVQVTEGDPIAGNDDPGTHVTFTVTKTGATDQTVTVRYDVVEDSALEPQDYFTDGGASPLSGTLTFGPGETTKTITLKITDDLSVEDTETFSVVLSNPTNATIADDTGIGTIHDTDQNVPDAVSEEVSVTEGSVINYNLMLVVDKSGSMDDDDLDPGPGVLTRLQLAIDALKNMLEAYDSAAGSIQVQIVTFDSNAQGVFPDAGTFYTVEQALAKLDQIATGGAGGNTDYDDATELAASAFPNWPNESATQQNIVYFLSDGDPNPSSGGLNDDEQAEWQDALNDRGIEVIAVGVGDGITDTGELAKVAHPSGNVILVENDTELGVALLGTLPNILSGNVLANGDTHGGDGWGAPKLVSVEHDGVVYTTASAEYDAGTQTLSLTTDLGGKLTISFATGQYTYQAPNVNHGAEPDPVEQFTYTIRDANGDTDSATLSIRIEDGEPAAYDNYAEVTEGHLVEQTTFQEGADNVVTGNVIADGNTDPFSDDPVGARDTEGSDGATLTRIDYVDGSGSPAFALVPANGSTVTVETRNGYLTIDRSGGYSYTAKLDAVTSGATEQDEFTYTLVDGDGDTDTAKLTIDVHDSVLPAPPEAPSVLNGTIVTNTNVANQPLRLTLTQLGNPLNSFSTILMLDSQGQQSSTLDFAVNAGFAIDNSQKYLVTLTSASGEKVNVTDFVLEGVTIEDASGNIQLGFPATGDGLTQVIQPNAAGTAGIPGSDTDVVYSDETAPFAGGPTTAEAQAGASVPYIFGTVGDDDLTGSAGMDVIAGGAGDDTIHGGGETDLLFGDAGDDLLFGDAGDDVLYGGAGNDTLVGGQGADRIDVAEGSDTVVYQAALDGGDLISGFSTSGTGQDFVDLDALFDSLNGGIDATDRSARVQLVQNGDDVTVNIDVSAGTGAGDGSSYVALATIQGVSVGDVSVGTAPSDDIQIGVG